MKDHNHTPSDELTLLTDKLPSQEAYLLCNFLTDHSLHPHVFDSTIDSVLPHLRTAIGTRVMIPSAELNKARKLLSEWEKPVPEDVEPVDPDPELARKRGADKVLSSCLSSTIICTFLFPGILNLYSLWFCIQAKESVEISEISHKDRISRYIVLNCLIIVISAVFFWFSLLRNFL